MVSWSRTALPPLEPSGTGEFCSHWHRSLRSPLTAELLAQLPDNTPSSPRTGHSFPNETSANPETIHFMLSGTHGQPLHEWGAARPPGGETPLSTEASLPEPFTAWKFLAFAPAGALSLQQSGWNRWGSWLEQIFSNLLSNVEKYAATGGVVQLGAQATRGQVEFAIHDQGPGVPRGLEEKIFQPFFRGSERVNEGASGTGLGLSIARHLAEAMGGQLVLQKGTHAGARFVLSLALAPATSLPPLPDAAP